MCMFCLLNNRLDLGSAALLRSARYCECVFRITNTQGFESTGDVFMTPTAIAAPWKTNALVNPVSSALPEL